MRLDRMRRAGDRARVLCAQPAPPPASGLGWWWDASVGRFDATSGGSSVDADGAAIASWADKINGTRVTQATEANRPTFDAIAREVAGAASTGVNTWFDVPSSVQFNRRACTVVIVGRPASLRAGASAGGTTFTNRILMNTTAGTPYNLYFDGPNAAPVGRVTVFDGAAAKTWTAATLRTSPNLIVLRGSAASSALTLNGTAATVSAPGTGTVTVNGFLGSPSATAAFQGGVRDILIYPSRNLSDAEVAALLPWAGHPQNAAMAGQEVYEGDSITQGLGATVNRGWTRRLVRPATLRRRDTAQSGIYLSTLVSQAASRVDPLLVSGEANKLYVFAGTNDIALGGATAAATYSSLTTYTTARQSAGWTVVWITPLPRGADDSATQTAIKDYRDLMLAGAAGAGVSVVDAWNIWGLNGNNSSPDFYDQTHPNDSGYAKIALLVGNT